MDLILLSSMTSLEKGIHQIILHSQADSKVFLQNTNTCFKNNLHSRLNQKSGCYAQVQLVGIYSSVALPHLHVELEGVKSYFFGSIHDGLHKRLHIGSGSVKKHEYLQVRNSSFFDVDISNLSCWSIVIRDRDGVKIPPQSDALTIIELNFKMDPAVEAPKYLYFGSEPLMFPTFLNIKPKCYATLLSFSHEALANVYPPHNEILIKYRCITDNDISCRQTKILIPTDFYSLEGLVQCFNSRILQYGIAFEAVDGRLKVAKNNLDDIQLKFPRKLAELVGYNLDDAGEFCMVTRESTFNLFDPLKTIPQVLTLKCSVLDDNNLSIMQKCLRLIYNNSKNLESASFEFEQKQLCLMTSGYTDSISFKMETFPNSLPVYFAKKSASNFFGCLEVQRFT